MSLVTLAAIAFKPVAQAGKDDPDPAGTTRQSRACITMSRPLPYLERIRSYYLALGYGEPYRWARQSVIPFTRLRCPLEKAAITIVTTASPYQPGKGDQGPGAPYNGEAKFFEVYSMSTDQDPDLRISHIAIDRAHTTAEDMQSWFPLRALRRLVEQGVIGSVGPRFHGLPTDRSITRTGSYAETIVERCRKDNTDAVLLVPNCPVCHQSVCIVAGRLESAGIATTIMGAARDIVEYVGAPRLMFNDLPLGNAAGIPGDAGSQLDAARLAVELLRDAGQPGTIWQSGLQWPGGEHWKNDYANAALLSEDEIAKKRAEFDRVKSAARKIRSS